MSAFDSSFAPSVAETISDRTPSDKAMERHFSVEEIRDFWGLSTRTVRRIFENEPGIIVFGNMGSLKKRRYITLRIPESVPVRGHRRLRKAG